MQAAEWASCSLDTLAERMMSCLRIVTDSSLLNVSIFHGSKSGEMKRASGLTADSERVATKSDRA